MEHFFLNFFLYCYIMKGYVYLICDGEYFKIGVTKSDIKKRLQKLQTGNSDDLWIRDWYETDMPFKIENSLHKKYFAKKIKNEWFDLSADDVIHFKETCKEIETRMDCLRNNPFFKIN